MDRTRWDYITTYGRTRTHHSWCASAVDSVYLSALDFRFLHLHQFLDPHLFTGILYITCIYTYIFTHTYIYIYSNIIYQLYAINGSSTRSLSQAPSRGPFGHRGLRRVTKHQARFANSLGPKVRRQTSAEMASSRGSSKWANRGPPIGLVKH